MTTDDKSGTQEDHLDASISPRGRFERMELALSRIEDKLDTKADQISLALLERQVGALERIDSNRVAAAEALKVEKDTTAAALKEVGDVRYRTLMWIVGLATAVSMAISSLLVILRVVNLE